MDMIKFFLGIAIIAFSSFCGHLMAKKYRQRDSFFKQFREFNERFLNEISYTRRPLVEFITAYSYEGEFRELLQNFYTFLKEDSSNSSFLQEGQAFAFLRAEDRQIIQDYFLMLGKGDTVSQRGYFSAMKSSLVELQLEAHNNAKRYSDLYIKIGFLCGLLLLILII
jgi:stage III sporulation protein AB